MKTEISKIRKNIMGTLSFDMQIKGMRKPQDFIVYPIAKNDEAKVIKIQSDKRIGELDLKTGKGKISQNHQNGAYNHHLMMDKLIDFEVSEVDAQALRMQIFTTADENAGSSGVIFTDNSGAVNVI